VWSGKAISAGQKEMGRPAQILKTKKAPDINFKASALERTDAELLLGCRRGDETSWNLLVERFQRLVASVPRRAELSPDAVGDIFQDVFLTLVEKLGEIKQPERLRAWLVTTAKFKTWEYISKEKLLRNRFRNCEDEGETIFEIPDERPLPDEVLIEIERQHLVRTALAGLDERSRKILSMLYSNKGAASYAEVAKEIGVGETSISPLRRRSLRKLAKILNN
jgi:RNA polymerase sigma factor (sigma-70 family)